MPGKPLPDAVYRGNDLRHEDKHVLLLDPLFYFSLLFCSAPLSSAQRGFLRERAAATAQGNDEMAWRPGIFRMVCSGANSRFFSRKSWTYFDALVATEIAGRVFANVLSDPRASHLPDVVSANSYLPRRITMGD